MLPDESDGGEAKLIIHDCSLSWVLNDPEACSCRDCKIGGKRAKTTMKGCQTGKGAMAGG